MSPPRLILHAGIPKTGSSALQSSFAMSIAPLRDAGIHYAEPVKGREARAGQITSGNFNPAKLIERFERACGDAPDVPAILFSNEACFRIFGQDPSALDRLIARGVPIRMLMYVRDPLELAVSSWSQGVKRGGATHRLHAVLRRGQNLSPVEHYIAQMDASGVDLVIRNYSRHRDRLLVCTEEMIPVPSGTLIAPPIPVINRSLTRAETVFMCALNEKLPKQKAARVADALCTRLPLLKPELPFLARADFDAFAAQVQPVVERLNTRLPASEHLRIPSYDPALGVPEHDHALSEAQRAVIDTALAEIPRDEARTQGETGALARVAAARRLAKRLLNGGAS